MRNTLTYYSELMDEFRNTNVNRVDDEIISGRWFSMGKNNAVKNESVMSSKCTK